MKVYLDFNATTPVANEVIECMTETLRSAWGNPSSGYKHGDEAKEVLETARENVAKMIGASHFDIIFTSGGTESNNLVIFGTLPYYHEWSSKLGIPAPLSRPHIITTTVEHDATLLPINHLLHQDKIDATFVPMTKLGRVSVDDILSQVRPSTCLISVMLANNETGIVMPVAEIGSALKIINKQRASKNEIKILFHTDAAQAFGKIEVDVNSLLVDYLTIVGHKFYGPRGGCLYARNPGIDTPVFPMLFGGGQERGMRPGTENTAVAAGLGRAAQLVIENLDKYNSHMLKTRQYLENKLKEEFEDNIVINFREENIPVLPNTVSVSFLNPMLRGALLLQGCEQLEASVGAACHESSKPSAVLVASGLTEELACNTLRLSVGRETSTEDIDIAVKDLQQSFKNCIVKYKL